MNDASCLPAAATSTPVAPGIWTRARRDGALRRGAGRDGRPDRGGAVHAVKARKPRSNSVVEAPRMVGFSAGARRPGDQAASQILPVHGRECAWWRGALSSGFAVHSP